MSHPRVSIGLPVYNGQRFIERTLDSLLRQTYGDFELILADNGSTDATPEICRRYAAADPRIQYHRSETNNGIVWNLNRAFRLSRGEFFKWQAADDLCHPEFLARCVQALDANPDAVLAFPRTELIDADDRHIAADEYPPLHTDSPHPHLRFRALACVNYRRYWFFEIFGLMRSDVLRHIRPFRPFARTDSVLIAQMALRGRFHHLPQALFYNRDHSDRSIRLPAKTRRISSRISQYLNGGPLPPTEWWNPAMKGRIVFPEWRLLREYLRAVHEAPLNLSDRLLCYAVLTEFTARDFPKLTRDVINAIRKLTTTQKPAPATPKADAPEGTLTLR